MKMGKMSHEVKVSDSNPPSKGKGHRDNRAGSCNSNAEGIKAQKMEAPWPKAVSKNL